MASRYKFADFRQEAKTDPFVLVDDDGAEISIRYPDTETMMELSEIPQEQPRRQLQLFCGDQYERVYELIRHEPLSVLQNLVVAMAEHFGMKDRKSVV